MIHYKRFLLLAVVIGGCILVMNIFEDNLFVKIFLGILIFGILFMIKGLASAVELPADENPDKINEMQATGFNKTIDNLSQEKTISHEDQIDKYLKLMIEVDEELRKEGNIDPNSPSYNMHLNYRISERL